MLCRVSELVARGETNKSNYDDENDSIKFRLFWHYGAESLAHSLLMFVNFVFERNRIKFNSRYNTRSRRRQRVRPEKELFLPFHRNLIKD